MIHGRIRSKLVCIAMESKIHGCEKKGKYNEILLNISKLERLHDLEMKLSVIVCDVGKEENR